MGPIYTKKWILVNMIKYLQYWIRVTILGRFVKRNRGHQINFQVREIFWS